MPLRPRLFAAIALLLALALHPLAHQHVVRVADCEQQVLQHATPSVDCPCVHAASTHVAAPSGEPMPLPRVSTPEYQPVVYVAASLTDDIPSRAPPRAA